MSTIHFVEDGKLPNGDRVTKSGEVELREVAEKLGRFEVHYTERAPTFNPGVRALGWGRYNHVVLEVEEGEASSRFSRAGFYYFIGLSPAEFESLFGVLD